MADEHGERTKTVVVGVDETVEGANRRRGCARVPVTCSVYSHSPSAGFSLGLHDSTRP